MSSAAARGLYDSYSTVGTTGQSGTVVKQQCWVRCETKNVSTRKSCSRNCGRTFSQDIWKYSQHATLEQAINYDAIN